MAHRNILLGLTTTRGSDWRKKISDAKRFNIAEVALFLTCLNADERQELYAALSDSPVTHVPHVHLRTDMTIQEIDWLSARFHVQYFNIHPTNSKYPFFYDYTKYASQIYVENSAALPTQSDLETYAGLCIDFSHWETGHGHAYDGLEELAKKYPIGCCHVSAVRFVWRRLRRGDDHTFYHLSDFDYMKKYIQYVPDTVSLELENDFEQQMKVREYIRKILE